MPSLKRSPQGALSLQHFGPAADSVGGTKNDQWCFFLVDVGKTIRYEDAVVKGLVDSYKSIFLLDSQSLSPAVCGLCG